MKFATLFARKSLSKLYLSSVGLPDVQAFVALFNKKQLRHLAIIPTACNGAPAEQRQYLQKREQQFTDLGFTTEVIDLAQYGSKKDQLTEKLSSCAGAWVLGGNTFYLNYWMRESGFDTLLPELLQKNLVYGGESAGAVVMGKTLHGIELLDNPADAPEVIWSGLGFVDYSILPHKGNQEYAARYDQAYEEMRLFTPVKTLTDEDFIVVK